MTAALEPTGHVPSADGTRIACWRLGAGPPVVIVHGGLGSSLGWRPVAQRLAEHFEVFIYDRRGRALIDAGELDTALDLGIAGLDAAGLVAADPRPTGAQRPDGVLALAPTVPRELRAVTIPGLDFDRYRDLDLSALVLAGTRSPEPQRRNCQRLAAALPQGRLVWLGGLGHVAHTAAPDLVAAEVSGFLAGVGQPSQAARSSSASGRT
jgi:pimeloyl-ACP methyl ester carboxylesterase